MLYNKVTVKKKQTERFNTMNDQIKTIIDNIDITLKAHQEELSKLKDTISEDCGYDQTLFESLTQQLESLKAEL